ncbi:hypothetical protein ACPSVR_004407 [Yersinia enterocolitica]
MTDLFFRITDLNGEKTLSVREAQDWIKRIESTDGIKQIIIESRPINSPVYYVAKGTRIFWIIFWLFCFFPLAVLMVFTAGNRVQDKWSPGRYLVTLSNDQRLVIDSAYDFALQFAQRHERANVAATFLAAGREVGEKTEREAQSEYEGWSKKL